MNIWKHKDSDLGLLSVRLGVAMVFIYHGWLKYNNIVGTAGFFAKLGLASYWVYLVMALELLGGLALLLGLKTRIIGVLLAVDMFFAIYFVTSGSPTFGGSEFELLLLLTSLGLALAGAGKYSLDTSWLKEK
ncbi:MAG: DoxX family protein [Candidatus Sungbacteria bacterium]|nr:DoxX family protein [Candidatus Sungbacteria bacterium]